MATESNGDDVFSRRQWLAGAGTLAAMAMLPGRLWAQAAAAPATRKVDQRYKVSVCDWMILKRQKLGAIRWASEVGCDGVEVDMGGLGERPVFENALRDEKQQQAYKDEAAKYNIEFSSMAMSGFYAQKFAERPGIDAVMQDCIDTMVMMGTKVAFLPLGVNTDLIKYPNLREATVERLKRAGEAAAKAGVVIGIETAYDAEGDAKLLDDIGSPGIGIYFNFSNAWQNDRDVVKELKILGAKRICQIHATHKDEFWLQEDPKVDMPKVKAALDEMGWRGWLVLERSRRANKGNDIRGNFGANAAFLKKVFQEQA